MYIYVCFFKIVSRFDDPPKSLFFATDIAQ